MGSYWHQNWKKEVNTAIKSLNTDLKEVGDSVQQHRVSKLLTQ
jgi:hypothetical protein